jgi:hypothetical protein
MHALILALGLAILPASKPHLPPAYPCKVAGPRSTTIYNANGTFRTLYAIGYVGPRHVPVYSAADTVTLSTVNDCQAAPAPAAPRAAQKLSAH